MEDTQPGTTPIPTDRELLAAWLYGCSYSQADEIRERLVAQLGDRDAAWTCFTEASELAAYDRAIVRARSELREVLAAVETQIGRAVELLGELAGRLYDVDYVEGGEVADMRAFLADAGRAIRATASLNPGREDSPT